ncbi:DUF2809 domain-containing protein [Cryobacterium melibiosiphilum]|uniref:DUF2809 domain-containing protein n=1 Tax=Cryobacterium melibiosiphilum TaxID=995039 RepID=A0A3A5MSU3_9MICO|nr:DUF2809 domain-containing protein [Cryobacterium melibiosiphilum]RJT89006.1 DUF2809 domain-containing protein [Cryobacterium melibiosiphilum]
MGNSRSAGTTRTTPPLNFRLTLALTGLAVIATGLAVNAVVTGVTGDLLGGALYAVLVCLAVAFMAPRRHPIMIGAVGFMLCALVELFQLTGIPSAIADVFAQAALVLGTTFVPLDFAAYLVGAGCAAAGLALSRASRTAN